MLTSTLNACKLSLRIGVKLHLSIDQEYLGDTTAVPTEVIQSLAHIYILTPAIHTHSTLNMTGVLGTQDSGIE